MLNRRALIAGAASIATFSLPGPTVYAQDIADVQIVGDLLRSPKTLRCLPMSLQLRTQNWLVSVLGDLLTLKPIALMNS